MRILLRNCFVFALLIAFSFIFARDSAAQTYSLTRSTEGAGSISLDPLGGYYSSNTVVSATATPASSWIFLNWGGDASGNINPVNITMNRNKAITAVFVQPGAIDASPQNLIAVVGDTVNFNVHAVGTPPPTYQWWFNNSALPGATGTTLTLTNVQLNQEGTYSVTVTNAYGGASNSATLTIDTNGCIGTNVVTVATEAALRNAIAIGGLVRCCFNGTITLSNTIIVTRNVTLDAHDRSVVISGNNSNRIFIVATGVKFSATNLVFANGLNVGQNGGYPGRGGAIYSDGGTVQLTSCTLLSNSVTGGPGSTGSATYTTNGIGGVGQGGAIYLNGGSLLLYSVNVISNMASGGPGASDPLNPSVGGNGQGGAIYSVGASVLILGCALSNNISIAPLGEYGSGGRGAAASGGALFQGSASVTLSNSTLAANEALGIGAGGIQKPGSAYGGAIAVSSGTTTIMRCTLNSNLALGGNAFHFSGTGEAQGGAIYSSATFRASESSFIGNQALSGGGSNTNTDGRGGAIYNSGLAVLNGCSLVSNRAKGGTGADWWGSGQRNPGGHGLGGAVFNGSQLFMTNCTAALNFARGGETYSDSGGPGGPVGTGAGGGVYNTSNGVFAAVNVTIASNAVSAAAYSSTNNGFADGANIAGTNGTIWLRNSILAYPGTNNNAWGTITDAGYNMSSDGSANFNSGSSFNFTDPLLGPLADNGGPTLTMALSLNSPAVDFGTSVGATPTDQRGFPRPIGLGFDMGALELNASPIQRPILTINRTGNYVRLNFGARAGATYVLQGSTTLTAWSDLEVIGPYGIDTQVNRTNSLYFPAIELFRLGVQ